MKVRMLTIMAGPSGSAHPGKVLDVDDATGREWVKRHFAVAMDPAPETAEAPPAPEAADEPSASEQTIEPPAPETAEATENKRGRKGR